MARNRPRSKKRSATSSPEPPPEFFLDWCIQGHKLAQALRDAGVVVHLHGDHFPQGEEDAVWIPVVAQRGWTILTKDKRIRWREIEKQAFINASARVFVLTSGNMTGEDIAETIARHLSKILRTIKKNRPPFVAAVNREGVSVLYPKPPGG